VAVTNLKFPVWRGEDVRQPFHMDEDIDITGWAIDFVASRNPSGLMNGQAEIQADCVVTGPRDYYANLVSAKTLLLVPAPAYYFQTRRVDDGSFTVLSSGEMPVRGIAGAWPA
jgi:hypothetical protein